MISLLIHVTDLLRNENYIYRSPPLCSIDEVACRLMDNEIPVERSTEIAHSIKSGISKTVGPYMRCSIGIAPNRYPAKVDTELQKADGLVVLRAQDLPQKLFNRTPNPTGISCSCVGVARPIFMGSSTLRQGNSPNALSSASHVSIAQRATSSPSSSRPSCSMIMDSRQSLDPASSLPDTRLILGV